MVIGLFLRRLMLIHTAKLCVAFATKLPESTRPNTARVAAQKWIYQDQEVIAMTQTPKRRKLTKTEREAVYAICGGRCAYCGALAYIEQLEAEREGKSDE